MKAKLFLISICMAAVLGACSIDGNDTDTVPSVGSSPETTDAVERETSAENLMQEETMTLRAEESISEEILTMRIGDTEVEVEWEDNQAVQALKDMAGDGEIVISMSMYGGFEQVGSIGQSLPRDDEQITTSSGDIVLYSGDQLVVFYGSNSWAYTRLGHITDKDGSQMEELLSGGDVTIAISLETEG